MKYKTIYKHGGKLKKNDSKTVIFYVGDNDACNLSTTIAVTTNLARYYSELSGVKIWE